MASTGAVDLRSNHNPPTTGEPTMMPCINEEGAPLEGGTGSAVEGNAYFGTQLDGLQTPTGSRLSGW